MNKILSLMLVPAVVALLTVGCTNDIMDKINENPDNPKTVPVDFILPQIITATATSIVSGDLSLYSSIYMELEAGVHGQMWNAETRTNEPTAATTYNNNWGAIYTNIRTAKDIIKICDDTSILDGGPVTKGMAQVIEALNLAILTNYFGDVPYTQTAVFDEVTGMPVHNQPVVDSQKDVYDAIFNLLDQAETNLGSEGGEPAKSADMLYAGNTTLWIKAINALRARYTLQLLKVSSNPNADLDTILEYVNDSFADASEQMSFDHYDEGVNPLTAFTYDRMGLGTSESFLDLLISKQDPRISQWGNILFMEDADGNLINEAGQTSKQWVAAGNTAASFVPAFNEDWYDAINQDWVDGNEDAEIAPHAWPAPNGSPIQIQEYYGWSSLYDAWDAPVHFMSYHELMFIKAEVLARKGQTAPALEALKAAVSAAFYNMEATIGAGFDDDIIDEYITGTVEPAFSTNALNEIMVQKYIACSGTNGEPHVAYDDYRRMKALGEDGYLTLANPKNSTQFPLRFTYGADDVNNNLNVQALYGNGQYIYTENVWWAGGTR